VLNIHIETRPLERDGQAVTNFEAQRPELQSDLASKLSKLATSRTRAEQMSSR
jgi:hypothetical protein